MGNKHTKLSKRSQNLKSGYVDWLQYDDEKCQSPFLAVIYNNNQQPVEFSVYKNGSKKKVIVAKCKIKEFETNTNLNCGFTLISMDGKEYNFFCKSHQEIKLWIPNAYKLFSFMRFNFHIG